MSARRGSISIDEIDSQISDAAREAEEAASGAGADAVVWEEVEARTSESTELSGTFVAFLALACLIASVGIFVGSPILIVGAMIVGPEFGPLAGLCVAVIERRRGVAVRSLTALAVGFPIGITAAFLFTLFCVAIGILDSNFHSSENDLVRFIVKPEEFSLIVALFAGAAGMLSLTSTKSGALIGVLVSVTTIPAAANIGVSAALANWSDWRGAMLQLSINLSAIVVAGVFTLYLQRVLYERRRNRHLGDRSRADAGLPADDRRTRHRATPRPPQASRKCLGGCRRAAQLAILAAAFAAGVGVATIFGAINLGVAFGVGQLFFAAALVWVLLR